MDGGGVGHGAGGGDVTMPKRCGDCDHAAVRHMPGRGPVGYQCTHPEQRPWESTGVRLDVRTTLVACMGGTPPIGCPLRPLAPPDRADE